MTVRGVDVSHYQGSVGWRALAGAGCAFAFIKATEGRTYTDPRFHANWKGARAAGIVRGAYHVGHPRNDPHADAAHFLSVVEPRRGDLVALDHELDDGQTASHTAAWARAWCERVHDRSGIRPVVYTYLAFAREGRCAGLDGYPLWIADPSRDAGHPRVPAPWRSWAFHQYSDSGRLGSYRGDVDVFNGSLDELHALVDRLSGNQEEDDMPEYVSVGTHTAVELPPNTWTTLRFDIEYSDSERQHGDKGRYPSVLTGHARFSATVDVRIKGLAKGTECQARFVETDPRKDFTVVKAYAPVEFAGTGGDTFVTLNQAAGSCDAGNHLYAQVIQFGGAPVTVTDAHAKVLFWR